MGGVATHVTELAAALTRRGHQVHVFTRPGEGVGSVRQIGNVWYHYCPHDLDRNSSQKLQACRSLVWHFFETEKHLGPFEVVHSHDWLTADAARWVKQERPALRAILTMHSTEYGRCGNNLWDGPSIRIRECEWQGTYAVDRVIAVSSTLKEELARIYSLPSWKCDVIHNGVPVHEFDGDVDPGDVKRSYGVGPLDPTVLFCGRLCLQKGPDLPLEAIPGLLRFHENAKFLFVGDGHMSWDLRQRAQHCVSVTPSASSVTCTASNASICSRPVMRYACRVAMNRSASSRWRAGRRASRAIASQVGGPNEFVWHGVTGLKIHPHRRLGGLGDRHALQRLGGRAGWAPMAARRRDRVHLGYCRATDRAQLRRMTRPMRNICA